MLAAHDDKALEALSSKGLTRRARRDADSRNATVSFFDNEQAEVSVEGQTVKLDAKGPLAALCTCSATSLCRHILTAVMVLIDAEAIESIDSTKQASSKPVVKDTHAEQQTVREGLLSLSNSNLTKFAGADLNAALSLAASVEAPEISEDGLNLTISLPDSPATVTFIAGQGLKGVAYKGPKTKTRLVTAACAIIIRRLAGVVMESLETLGLEDSLSLSEQDVFEMANAISSSVKSVLTGVPAIAADKLFEQAIAARVQIAPRLTSQLRALAKQAVQATTRHIDYNPTEFLENAANTYALCRAISQNPNDVNLTGSLKRNYEPSEDLTLLMLGAKSWRSASGARGLTCYGYSPERKDWYETTTARAAGMDLSFSGAHAYEGVLWRSGTPKASMGRSVILPNPSISKEGQISQTIENAAKISLQRLNVKELELHKVFISSWESLREQITLKMGIGLRRRTFPVPILIKPEKHHEMNFDEMSQRYKWGVVDKSNEVIYLNLPAKDTEVARHIQSSRKKICGVFLTARFESYEIIYEPISILLDYKSELTVFNIGLDHIEYRRLMGRRKLNISDYFPQFIPPIAVEHASLMALLDMCLDTLVDVSISPNRKKQLKALRQNCEQAGLMTLAHSINTAAQNLNQENILKAVYVLNETRLLILLSD